MTSERKFKALVAVGKDRPGLVHGISKLIHESGASIEDSRMAVLGGEFAMILLFSGTSEALRKIELRQAEVGQALGLELSIRDTSEPARVATRHRLVVRGLDRPGIVDAIARVLAAGDVNVETLDTRIEHQPLTGTQIFVLETLVRLPPSLSLGALEGELSRVCDEEQLELEIEPAKA